MRPVSPSGSLGNSSQGVDHSDALMRGSSHALIRSDKVVLITNRTVLTSTAPMTTGIVAGSDGIEDQLTDTGACEHDLGEQRRG